MCSVDWYPLQWGAPPPRHCRTLGMEEGEETGEASVEVGMLCVCVICYVTRVCILLYFTFYCMNEHARHHELIDSPHRCCLVTHTLSRTL